MKQGNWALLALLAGCSGDKTGTDTGTNTDTDTDTDSDTDTDTDTDSDTDTDTDTGNSPVTGQWQGDCPPNFGSLPDTGPYAYLDDLILGAELQLNLTEQGGDVQGDGLLGFQVLLYGGYGTGDTAGWTTVITSTYTFTSVIPVGTQGTWDGTELVLAFADMSYNPPYPAPLELTATISGDTMTGALVLYPNATSGLPTLPFDCTLTRQ